MLKSERRWHRWKRFVPLFKPIAWVLVRFPPLGVALANQGLRHALKQANEDIAERMEARDAQEDHAVRDLSCRSHRTDAVIR